MLSKKTKKWLSKNGILSFKGKTVVITGANSGIGFKSAEIAVYLNARVILACRNIEKANKAKSTLLKDYPDADIDIMTVDLSSFRSIDVFIDEIKSNNIDIDIFLNNAGVFKKPNEVTADGLDLVLGTNYFGAYYLTEKAVDYLSSLSHKTVYINTVSLIHKIATVDYDDFFCTKRYNNFTVYARSKLCLAKYTYYKAQKYCGSNVCILLSHPGIAITPLGANAFGNTVKRLANILQFIFNSPEKSALSLPYIMANKLPCGSLSGPDKLFGGWGYPKICKLSNRAKTGAEELLNFTEKIIGDIKGKEL